MFIKQIIPQYKSFLKGINSNQDTIKIVIVLKVSIVFLNYLYNISLLIHNFTVTSNPITYENYQIYLSILRYIPLFKIVIIPIMEILTLNPLSNHIQSIGNILNFTNETEVQSQKKVLFISNVDIILIIIFLIQSDSLLYNLISFALTLFLISLYYIVNSTYDIDNHHNQINQYNQYNKSIIKYSLLVYSILSILSLNPYLIIVIPMIILLYSYLFYIILNKKMILTSKMKLYLSKLNHIKKKELIYKNIISIQNNSIFIMENTKIEYFDIEGKDLIDNIIINKTNNTDISKQSSVFKSNHKLFIEDNKKSSTLNKESIYNLLFKKIKYNKKDNISINSSFSKVITGKNLLQILKIIQKTININEYNEINLGVFNIMIGSSDMNYLKYIPSLNDLTPNKVYYLNIKVFTYNSEHHSDKDTSCFDKRSRLNSRFIYKRPNSDMSEFEMLNKDKENENNEKETYSINSKLIISMMNITNIINSQRYIIDNKYQNIFLSKISHDVKTSTIGISQIVNELQDFFSEFITFTNYNNIKETEVHTNTKNTITFYDGNHNDDKISSNLNLIKNYSVVNLVKIQVLSETISNTFISMSDYIKGIYLSKPDFEDINISEIYNWVSCCLTAYLEIYKKNVAYDIKCDDSLLDLAISVDIVKLRISIYEVIKNIINNISSGSVCIVFKKRSGINNVNNTVFYSLNASIEESLEIIFEDTGKGISLDTIKSIRKDFEKIDNIYNSLNSIKSPTNNTNKKTVIFNKSLKYKENLIEKANLSIVNSSIYDISENFSMMGKLSLGLKIVKSYCKAMNIDILISSESTVGTKTVFVFSLKRKANLLSSMKLKSQNDMLNRLKDYKDFQYYVKKNNSNVFQSLLSYNTYNLTNNRENYSAFYGRNVRSEKTKTISKDVVEIENERSYTSVNIVNTNTNNNNNNNNTNTNNDNNNNTNKHNDYVDIDVDDERQKSGSFLNFLSNINGNENKFKNKVLISNRDFNQEDSSIVSNSIYSEYNCSNEQAKEKENIISNSKHETDNDFNSTQIIQDLNEREVEEVDNRRHNINLIYNFFKSNTNQDNNDNEINTHTVKYKSSKKVKSSESIPKFEKRSMSIRKERRRQSILFELNVLNENRKKKSNLNGTEEDTVFERNQLTNSVKKKSNTAKMNLPITITMKSLSYKFKIEQAIDYRNDCILIVDDEYLLRSQLNQMITSVLEKSSSLSKYNIIKMEDGVDTLNFVVNSQLKIRLVISDENMKYINGSKSFEILTFLMNTNKIQRSALFIYTALSSQVQLDEIQSRCHCNEIVSKPISITKLEGLLKKYSII